MMERTPVVQEGPPNTSQIKTSLKESESSTTQWQSFNRKIANEEQNSKLLFLTVGFINL